ncbi:MAG: zf-HC2 domain-containing protein [Planctomycetes bacterium]|nr:zf-HC2 domain-containing protein [Planctomycetota bacterium]
MSTCDHIKHKIPELALGILPPDAKARVQDHISSCAACARRLARAEEAAGLMRREADAGVPAPPTNVLAILGGAARKAVPPTPKPAWIRMARAAILVFAFVGLAAVMRARVAASDGALRVEVRLPWAGEPSESAEGWRDASEEARWAAIEPRVQDRVREEVRDLLVPALRDVALSLQFSEERRQEEMITLARYLDGTRFDDAARLEDAIVRTREDLQATQSAVVQVARHASILYNPK